MSASAPDFLRDFADETIECNDCGESFIWTAGAQRFFRDKGLKNKPVRCKPCKEIKVERIAAIANLPREQRPAVSAEVACARCGQRTIVPFYPSQGRPVYCRACFHRGSP